MKTIPMGYAVTEQGWLEQTTNEIDVVETGPPILTVMELQQDLYGELQILSFSHGQMIALHEYLGQKLAEMEAAGIT